MTDQVDGYEAKPQLSKLLERVEAGEEIIIPRRPPGDDRPDEGLTLVTANRATSAYDLPILPAEV